MKNTVIHINAFDVDKTDTELFLKIKKRVEENITLKELSNEEFVRILIGSALRYLNKTK